MSAKKIAVTALFIAAGVRAQSPSRAAHPPILDGDDRDDAWRAAECITAFRMFDPTEDGVPTFETNVRIAYDDNNLYLFVRALDPRPDSILALLSRRDVKTASDQIKVMIDSYHDRRTGYEFAVNPAGVKRDYYTYDDGEEDPSWDAVWDVATRIDSLGWTAEFRIPLSQIRYAPADEHVFGIMVIRDVARLNERYSWPLFRRSVPGLASQFAAVRGFTRLGSPTRLEVSPYALTRNVSAARAAGRIERQQQAQLGADVKYGLTSNLTLDATVNPDFGQVEADPATLNLTAFETFFAEQRPFFVEGTDIFQATRDATALFYSRRIGRAPQLSGLVSDPNADIPGASRILGAGKLTGRLSDGTSVGVLSALTEQVRAGGLTIEPATAYTVVRAVRDFSRGEHAIGVIATNVHRALDAATEPYLRRDALVVAMDARSRFSNGKYALRGSLATSTVRGSTTAIIRTQRSSVHYFQRPDDELAVDAAASSLSGTELILSGNVSSGVMRLASQYQRISPSFETNDLGFLARADQQRLYSQLSLVPPKPVGSWRNARVDLTVLRDLTAAGLPTGSFAEAYLSGYRPDGSRYSLDTWVDNVFATYCDRCARGGPALRLSPAYNALFNYAGNPRLRLSPIFAAIYTVGDGGRSTLWRVRPYVVYRPSTRASVEFGTRYQRNEDNTQYLATVGAVGADSTHYLFAHLTQDLLSFTARMDMTMRPTLTLQMYAEPFVSAGHYTRIRELSAPRAGEYDARFRGYGGATPNGDFNQKSFNASAVLRWEYRPASTLFVVWTQAREQFDLDRGAFTAARDYRNLFAARPDNVFLVKASYWLGR